MKPVKLFSLIALALITLVAYTQLTIFVVQPIGAIPDGLTVLIWRRLRRFAGRDLIAELQR